MFIVLLTGEGEGCDYTIGCNMVHRTLEATNWDAALREVGEICDEFGEARVETAEILDVKESRLFDITGWRADREKKEHEESAAVAAKVRKDTYEKLKKEFEGA